MGLRYPDQKHADCFFITTTFKNWLKLGNIPGFYEAMADNLVFCLNKYKALLTAYVFMPSHIHFIIFIEGKRLSHLMRDFKKYIAQKVAKEFNIKESGIWCQRYDRVAIYSEEIMKIKINYIHNNPVKDGIASNAEEWEWSSATDYVTDKKGKITIYKDWF